MNRHTQRVILNSAIIGIVIVAIAYFVQGGEFAVGVAFGAALGTINIRLWATVVNKLVKSAAKNGSGSVSTAGIMIAKHALIVAAFIVLVFGFGLNVIALGLGISNVVAASLLEAFLPTPTESL